MVYQGLLLSDRRRLRTESIEEHATPNSLPAQWPGKKSNISLKKHPRRGHTMPLQLHRPGLRITPNHG